MKTLQIALNTYRELVRSKVLYLVLFFAAILLIVATLFGTVTIGDQIMVIKNFGLAATSLFTVIFTLISGSNLLHKELARKTIYNILAKAVERGDFVLGKYLGTLMTACVMTFLMCLGLGFFLMLFGQRFDLTLLQAGVHIAFELIIVCACTIFFSSLVVTPILSGMFAFGVFAVGRCSEDLLYFVKEGNISDNLASILRALYYVLPQLDKLNISDLAVYGQGPSIEYSLVCFVYASCYAGVLLVISNIIFRRREFY